MKYSGGWIMMPPADRADPRNEAEPIYEQNENEERGEKPKRFADKIAPDDALEKIVKTLNQPFPKILNAARDRIDFSRRQLRKNDDRRRHDPRHQHRVCHGKLADLKDRRRL